MSTEKNCIKMEFASGSTLKICQLKSKSESTSEAEKEYKNSRKAMQANSISQNINALHIQQVQQQSSLQNRALQGPGFNCVATSKDFIECAYCVNQYQSSEVTPLARHICESFLPH